MHRLGVAGNSNGTMLFIHFDLMEWPTPASGRPYNMAISVAQTVTFANYADVSAVVMLQYTPMPPRWVLHSVTWSISVNMFDASMDRCCLLSLLQ